jgi:hypothetical protein
MGGQRGTLRIPDHVQDLRYMAARRRTRFDRSLHESIRRSPNSAASFTRGLQQEANEAAAGFTRQATSYRRRARYPRGLRTQTLDSASFERPNKSRTHCCVVVSTSDRKPQRCTNSFKAYATRRLRESGLWTSDRSPWSDKASQRLLWNDISLIEACDYVMNRQGPDLDNMERWLKNPPANAGGSPSS